MKLTLFGLIVFCILSGCNKSQSPQSTVNDYLYALDHFEWEKANKLLVQNEDNKLALDGIKQFANKLKDNEKEQYLKKAKNRTYNIIEKEKSANKALIIATNNEGSFTTVIIFELIKETDNWLIKNFKTDDG